MSDLDTFAFSAISRTRMAKPPQKVIVVRDEKDLQEISAIPRYELFRGIEGDIILDLTRLRGVEDNGNYLKVLSGTKWSEVLPYAPEIWSNLDYSVGGTIHFDDEGFGFNEFGEMKNKVNIEGYSEGKKYVGKYTGGIIFSVSILKENKAIKFMRIIYSLENIIGKVKSWFSSTIPPFRDISIFKTGNEVNLLVSYPTIRESLVSKLLNGFEDSEPLYPKIKPGYIYAGKIPTNDLSPLFGNVENLYITVRRDMSYFRAFSKVPLNLPGLLSYSDKGENMFNGCILCGKCVDTCPHSWQHENSITYSPFGFYTLTKYRKQVEVANCHMCGVCNTVCPVQLPIVESLRNYSNPPKINLKKEIYIPTRRSIIITPISESLVKDALKLIKYFSTRGEKIGIVTLNESIDSLVKGNIDKNKVYKTLEKIDEVITLTPEEYNYLIALKNVKVIEITFAFELLMPFISNLLKKMKVHSSCFYSFEGGIKGCSYELLNLINGEGKGKTPDAEISLCPLASKKLGIKSYIDILQVNLDIEEEKAIYQELLTSLQKSKDIITDSQWYLDLDNSLFEKVIDNIITKVLENKSTELLIDFYLNLDDYDFSSLDISIKERIALIYKK
ncbi:4Fe-4S dicluster domain-containing protein [Acidianus sp. RZ1]|uniref:4Fe-4S dicluster domain-containing protein n=1 Tax=Acidianus sp. RZ1 TaxID=1540082 RepID=UPI0014925A52|nr:4Fe-4S dicluster domain-containing protein [Acidianus sp. RZ1]NON62250.1 4Fe-4S dicluster domain-containing protein [Acidianus sp. RZ1]